MIINIVLTYPVYHDFSKPIDIHSEPFREHQIARILSEMGHETELWYTGHHQEYHPPANKRKYSIRLFVAARTKGPTKSHFSNDMINHAKSSRTDLYLLKGVDGGTGIHLLKNHIIPDRKTFGYIIGGHTGSTYMKRASIIFYESNLQQKFLIDQNRVFKKYTENQKKLILLPKSIDTELFSPRKTKKRWDLLVVGRLISHYKNYKTAGILSRSCCLAVAGGGPDAPRLKKKYPHIHWLGEIPYHNLPQYYAQSKLFMVTGFKDYHPRVLSEAMSCGIPCVAFSGRIQQDVIPSDCGLIVSPRNFVQPVLDLVRKPDILKRMGLRAREVAMDSMGRDSCKIPLEKMSSLLSSSVADKSAQ